MTNSHAAATMTVVEADALRAQVGHRSGTTPSYRRPGTPPDLVAAACIAFNRVQFHHTPEHVLHAAHANIDGPMAELRLLARIGAERSRWARKGYSA